MGARDAPLTTSRSLPPRGRPSIGDERTPPPGDSDAELVRRLQRVAKQREATYVPRGARVPPGRRDAHGLVMLEWTETLREVTRRLALPRE